MPCYNSYSQLAGLHSLKHSGKDQKVVFVCVSLVDTAGQEVVAPKRSTNFCANKTDFKTNWPTSQIGVQLQGGFAPLTPTPSMGALSQTPVMWPQTPPVLCVTL